MKKKLLLGGLPIGVFVTILAVSPGSWRLSLAEWKDVLISILWPPKVRIEMVFVEGGMFDMGCTAEQRNCNEDENPVHSVKINDFYIGKYEVTQRQWRLVMDSDPSKFKGDNLPVENVSWNDVQEFIEKLNKKTGKGYRMLTEAEWEYAARGGKRSRDYIYSGSDNIDDVAWYESNSGNKTNLVGTGTPNELGLYEMSGNVLEWVNDWYDSLYYKNSAQTKFTGPDTGMSRVYRGGCWQFEAERCRVSFRAYYAPDNRFEYLGVRLALST